MKRTLAILLSMALSFGMLVSHSDRLSAQDQAAAGPAQTCADSEESAFLQLINDYRAQNGLPPLAFSQTLSVAAETLSLDMATNDFFSHTGSNGSTFVDRITAAGYPDPGNTAENIFAGSDVATGAMESWRNSPGHNANMLSPTAKAIGIARVNNPNSTWKWYWTTTFGATVDGAACTGDGVAAVVQGVPQVAAAPAEQPAGATGNAPQQPAGQELQPADPAGATNQPAAGQEAAAADAGAAPPAADQEAQPADTAGNTAQPEAQPAAASGNGNATTGGEAAVTTTGANAAPACGDAEELAFLASINEYRAANGVPPLAMSPTLTSAAKGHSQDMATKNYFDHVGQDGSTFASRIAAAGYPGGTTAENIFAGDQSAAGAMESWRNSPGHNANMLNPAFTAIGIGRAFDPNSDFGWYWTTTFGDVVDAACAGGQTQGATTGQAGQAGQAGQPGQDGTTGNGQTGQAGNTTGGAMTDSDGDGLLDESENALAGTDPTVFDTDGGGVGDGDEWSNGKNPLDPSDDNAGGGQANGGAAADTDGDGLLDDEEAAFGTNPNVADSDGDGVNDLDELFNGTDPLDPASA